MKIPEKYKNNFKFSYNANVINHNTSLLKKKNIPDNSKINVLEKDTNELLKGKSIIAKIQHNKNTLITFNIGTLNQIKDFYSYLMNHITNYNRIKTIEIEGKDYENELNNTFSSVGIRKDFVCKIKYFDDGCCICH